VRRFIPDIPLGFLFFSKSGPPRLVQALLRRLRLIMQNQQVRMCAWHNGVRTAFIIAEFHEHGTVLKRLNDRADLSARQAVRRVVRQERHGVEQRRLRNIIGVHHSTEHVANRGASSPARMIQKVLIMAFQSCRAMVIHVPTSAHRIAL